MKVTSDVKASESDKEGLEGEWLMATGFLVRFKPDTELVEIVSIDPNNGQEDVSVSANITINFSKAINASTIKLASNAGECKSSSIEISNNDFLSCVLLAQNFSISDDKKSVTISAQGDLEYAKTYKIKVKTSLKDIAGNSLSSDWISPLGFSTDSWRGSSLLRSPMIDEAKGMAIDSTGHIVIAGKTSGPIDGEAANGGQDILLSRYSPSGEKLWVKVLGTAQDDLANDVAVDAEGDIYVAGYTMGLLDGEAHVDKKDIFFSKFKSDGLWLFTRTLGTSYQEEAFGIEVCGDYVYLAGTSYGNLDGQTGSGDYDVFLAQYRLNGVQQWLHSHNSSGIDEAYAIACSPTNSHVYISGRTYGTLGSSNLGGQDAFISKYDTAGNREWTSQFGTSSADEGKAIAISSQGHIYVSGYTSASFGDGGYRGAQDLYLWSTNRLYIERQRINVAP